MRSRKFHAVSSCVAFILLAAAYSAVTGTQVDLLHVAAWSAAGIACYIALSYAFGFDPHRTRLDPLAADWVQYVDRWELRLGQATLSMLGCMVVGAQLFDSGHFVSAVVSGTLSAWTYFAWRLYAGGYTPSGRRRRASVL
jgi:hypothetical protein